MQITPLSEGTFTVDKTKNFVPFDEKEDQLQKRPAGSLLVEVQPFVIVTSKDILLFDTGLGFTRNNLLQLYQNLMGTNISPADVTKVLLTHLHKDHAGGISHENPESFKRELSFPNARYYMQERELNYAFEKGSPSFIIDEFEILKRSSQVISLKEDKGIIDDYIFWEVTSAHSAYHQVFWIKEKGQIIFFGGDDAPQLQQMKHRFVAKYDFDGEKARELRRQWWEQGKQEKWTFLFYHDVKNPVYEFK